MKTTVICKILPLTVLFIGMVQSASGQQPGDRKMKKERIERMHSHWWQAAQFVQIPNLTDEQKEQIKNILLAGRQQMLPLRNEMGEKVARLRTLRTTDPVDMDAVDAIVEELGDVRVEMMKQRLASEQKIRELLTDEQRLFFDSRKVHGRHHAPHFQRDW